MEMVRTIVNFFQEARGELMKVAWPSRHIVTRSTIMVIILTVIMAGFLGGLDYVFNYILKTFIVR